tara:strand:- start:194 stop:520 length:327 start_codon:yes stop_codon:yes gene_type:complete
MKWSYTGGKLNVSSDEEEQQFLLKDLVEEASRHQARKKKIFIFFIVFSVILLTMQNYGSSLSESMSIYFYIGYFLTPIIISLLISGILYAGVRRSPKKFNKLNKHFKD